MNTIVMQADKKLQEKIRTDLAQHHISNNNPYVVFSAKISGATVLLYTSGNISEFQKNNWSAYNYSKINGWLYEFYKKL